MASLYIVGPLGDAWRDVPRRAQRILQESSLIVTQDADSVGERLRQGSIRTPVVEINARESLSQLVEALQRGDVAWLITSLAELAGPSRCLIDQLAERGVELLSVPGPSTALAGLVVSGLPADSVTLLGPLPDSGVERRGVLEKVAAEPRTLVCGVAAERLAEALCDVLSCLGDRRVTLYGERDVWRGRASQVVGWSGAGRLTLVVEGAGLRPAWTKDQVRVRVRERLAAGASLRDVAGEVAQRAGWPKREVYRLALSIRRED